MASMVEAPIASTQCTDGQTAHDDTIRQNGDVELGLGAEKDLAPYSGQTTKLESENGELVIYVTFEPGDPKDPINFSKGRKWMISILASILTALSAAAASTYNMGFPSMIRDLQCTSFQATTGLPLYTLGFAVIPLVTTSFSEEVGRKPLYVYSTIGLALMHLMMALSKDIHTVLVSRFLAGCFGSTGAAMVGGSLADIWLPSERGIPMAIFTIAAMASTGVGPVAAGWIEMNPRFEWRWIQWFHLIATGILAVLIVLFMNETRSSVILTRLARRKRKETGDERYRSHAEESDAGLRRLIWVSCTRPLHLLFTEPVVASFSLWVGFAWGVVYCFISSVSPVFKTLHHFNTGQVGTVFITFLIGSLLGYLTTLYQEKLYTKYVAKRGPEARLHASMFAGVLFPAAMFMYAWSTLPNVHWIALAIALTLFLWASFIIYLAVFSYLAEVYGPFASSALAGQTLCRNVFGLAFPLFTEQMFNKLTYKWANTLFALIATVMIPIPFVLYFKGEAIRSRSRFAKNVTHKAVS
ncbi:MFS general substrate transporter [Cristinia sonorae]|uniref:MFS general substrate transporter n=1 Tax=Cristinia sonorae TaxID=1940300 RepID=A0A8K0XPS8_9AGAR|nr:MFS general substrate transporter [Cristinia sonorae]